jgi:hypothetical protein
MNAARPEPDSFYLALDENPGDLLTVQALADWYEENGEANAASCLRWLAVRERWPFRFQKEGGPVTIAAARTWNDGWFWWAVEDPWTGYDWGHPEQCRLPQGLWDRLRHGFTHQPRVFKEYPTRRAAYETLFTAWPAFRRRGSV